MKRMWAVLVLLALTLTISVLGARHTRAVTLQMERTVQEAKTAQERGDEDTALAFSRKAVSDWRDAHRVLCLYMLHDRLEDIDQTLAVLPELCQDEQREEFLSECDRSLAQFWYLNESELLTLDNLF